MTQNVKNIEDFDHAALLSALQWYLDHGADDLWMEEPQDRTKLPEIPKPTHELVATPDAGIPKKVAPTKVLNFQDAIPQEDMMGAAEAIQEAQKIASACQTLEDLQQAIKDFEALSIRKTASNMVFADGNPDANVMVIGEAPEAQDDVSGKPFMDQSGQLLDKILACIHLDRRAEEPEKSVYLSNVLNWRPPGNRTPTHAEFDISRAFITRHIALVKPKALIICGGGAGQTLLKSQDTISKLRGKFHDYDLGDGTTIPAIVTYHPAYLLRTPAQKKATWADMLMFQDKIL